MLFIIFGLTNYKRPVERTDERFILCQFAIVVFHIFHSAVLIIKPFLYIFSYSCALRVVSIQRSTQTHQHRPITFYNASVCRSTQSYAINLYCKNENKTIVSPRINYLSYGTTTCEHFRTPLELINLHKQRSLAIS